ncbi:MAG: hypothetical protein JRE28_13620 [Deltaproteobacteria bacterium]|nr:hypothetical protein [Deltaproteobacteria bacterium]
MKTKTENSKVNQSKNPNVQGFIRGINLLMGLECNLNIYYGSYVEQNTFADESELISTIKELYELARGCDFPELICHDLKKPFKDPNIENLQGFKKFLYETIRLIRKKTNSDEALCFENLIEDLLLTEIVSASNKTVFAKGKGRRSELALKIIDLYRLREKIAIDLNDRSLARSRELEKHVDEKRKKVLPGLSKKIKALALLIDHPDWTDKKIADEAGLYRTSLYRYSMFKSLRKLIKDIGKNGLPRGYKMTSGIIEAYSS